MLLKKTFRKKTNAVLQKFIVHILLILHVFTGSSFAEDIRDIQPPVNFPPNYFFLYLLFGILALTAILFLVRFFIKGIKKPKSPTAIIKPSWLVAFELLEELKKKNLPSQGKFKEYYTLLSNLVRKYIENRFKIKAPEMTTQEFLLFLKKSRDFSAENKKLLEDFLNSCDMVKFAKYGPTINEAKDSFKLVKRYIDETKEAESTASVMQT